VPDLNRCAQCGATLQPSDRFCPLCGTLATAGALAAAPVVNAAAAAAPAAPAGLVPADDAAHDRGWFASTRASSMLGSALMLLIGALLLMGIGQIDRTGSIVIISLLVLEGAAAMLLLGLVRGLFGMFAKG
jgi:hypothetical protein